VHGVIVGSAAQRRQDAVRRQQRKHAENDRRDGIDGEQPIQLRPQVVHYFKLFVLSNQLPGERCLIEYAAKSKGSNSSVLPDRVDDPNSQSLAHQPAIVAGRVCWQGRSPFKEC